jgi:2-oxoglutarate ferredoxin oxidoreductase subunit alpha
MVLLVWWPYFGIDMDKILAALTFHFKGKQKPIDMNFNIVKASAEWAAANLTKTDPYRVEPMTEVCDECIMTDGNLAAALGALYGGLQFCAWYPITPASAWLNREYIPQLRKDPAR